MILHYEEALLTLIDDTVASASDDELFAGGYLRGHISLSAAKCESMPEGSIAQMDEAIENSLAEARSELSPADQQLVAELWAMLQNQAKQLLGNKQ
ncbi:YfcL family protein [Photobacterium rosenbergii]|uniref:YfcL family protein n=1 Tax=Photobacterium rosenbergii TaxID=294936 RepID=UPI001C9909D2|nr:YfcL family protein [Photobacterium rosenbergii]MBY5947396.1 YfcL family protein [Photobacterium rosenbergii]